MKYVMSIKWIVSLNIFLFINTDTIHVNINIFQLGFRKKSKTYMNLSPQVDCWGRGGVMVLMDIT